MDEPDWKNIELMNSIAAEWRRLTAVASLIPKRVWNSDVITVKIQCYNKDEADKVKAYMKNHHPEIPLIVTWLDFGL